MGRHLVPAAMVAAMLAFAVAALTAAFIDDHPRWWRGAVALVTLGGIAPMIYSVNIRVVPVFARRSWPSPNLLRAEVVTIIGGAWLVYAGHLGEWRNVVTAGAVIALASGLIYFVNIIRLFRQPATGVPSPLPFPEQAAVDKVGIQFTRLSGLYFLFGLGLGVALSRWTPSSGRWDLAWAHAMLVGFFLNMASGTAYHVLPRWTGRPWRALWPIRLHLVVVAIGLPLMLGALATGSLRLFEIAGPLQAAAVALFLVTIAPQIGGLPGLSAPPVAAAAACLAIGVLLGAWFAIDPAAAARLRTTHAEVNLFGWAGLLVSGMGLYLVPRFAGRPLAWPSLARMHLFLLAAGVVLGAGALAFDAYDTGPSLPLVLPQGLIATGFLAFAANIAGTFFRSRPVSTIDPIRLQPRRPAAPAA